MYLSLIGLIIAPLTSVQPTVAAEVKTAPTIRDVVLDSENMLHGRLVDRGFSPIQGEVLVRQGARLVATTETAEDGRFAVRLTQGGMYELSTSTDQITVRAWTQAAAPPQAPRELVYVHGHVLRGQEGTMPFRSISPWLIAGVAAAAIGVPILVANHRDDREDGS